MKQIKVTHKKSCRISAVSADIGEKLLDKRKKFCLELMILKILDNVCKLTKT